MPVSLGKTVERDFYMACAKIVRRGMSDVKVKEDLRKACKPGPDIRQQDYSRYTSAWDTLIESVLRDRARIREWEAK